MDASTRSEPHRLQERNMERPLSAHHTAAMAFGGLETRQPLTPAQIEGIASGLLAELSLDEKIRVMSGDTDFWSGLQYMLSGGYGRQPWPAGAIPRLGIPGIRFADGPRGVVLPGATTFPVPMARGASWDPLLEERIGDAIGRELRACGANLTGAVCINLLRHPAWGRAQETYGEDTVHLGEMGVALTRGIQRHAMACVKHFALNSMENARFKVDVTANPRALHEVYLPHFKRVVDAGVASVMSAYNSLNGEWAGQNEVLLRDILKGQWGFTGFVQTDWVFGMRDAKKAVLAGQDLDMPTRNLFHRNLAGLVERGEVPVEVVDDAVLRLLRQQVRFGQGRDPGDYTADVVGCEAHRRLAREAAQKGIVLLKNAGDVLPLTEVRSVAVIGRLADTPNTGDRGSSGTQPPYVVTPLQGLRSAAGAPFTVAHDDGSDRTRAAALAGSVEVAICVVGYTHLDEGEYVVPGLDGAHSEHFPSPSADEMPIVAAMADRANRGGGFAIGGDRSSLALGREDEELIKAVAAANPRTVVAVMAGSAVITEAWRDQVAAILMLWYPGMEGGHALADVLLGHVNPSGKLPCVFARAVDDLPHFDRDATAITYDLWHGYRKLERDGAAPAFPFGFGLSYTTFSLANLRLAQGCIGADGTLTATVEVTNTGQRDGEEVVQLYVGARSSSVERAPRELKAFVKVSLEPGEMRVVRLAIPAGDLAWFDAEAGWSVEPGDYEVIVGRHSLDDEALRARLTVD
jgi:beta-glucosidase